MKKLAALSLALMVTPAMAAEPIWDANKIILKSEKLADGVFAITPNDAKAKAQKGIPIATTSGFIIGEKGVLVIDSMLNKRLADQVRVLVKAQTSKPIRWLVNTSYHGDHSYGNYTFPDSVTIIQHATTAHYVQTKFEHDTQFMMKNFGKGRGIEQAVARTGDILIPDKASLTLDLGGQIVEIKDFGFAQTGGDLFVWHPKAKALWTGNPIISTKPALPWLLDGHLLETLATMRAVYAAVPSDTKVVPGHGPVTDPSAIKWHIDYLADVRDGVKAAIAKGLTLEQTVKSLPLSKYKGYGLYGWVHPSLNVPAAYKDLSK